MEKRLNKWLSEQGFCSRRAADQLIEEGRITLNGKPVEQGIKVTPGDIVCVDGKEVKAKEMPQVYLAFHKPIGIVCTTDTAKEPNNIIDYINYPERIFPIGRLDKQSEGLILLTNDGDLVNFVTDEKGEHEKEYEVTVDSNIPDRVLQRMAQGVRILDTITKPCIVERISKNSFRIILTQGLNRQIRRMTSYFGYEVTRLKRVRIMHIPLDVPKGQFRDLTPSELTELLAIKGPK